MCGSGGVNSFSLVSLKSLYWVSCCEGGSAAWKRIFLTHSSCWSSLSAEKRNYEPSLECSRNTNLRLV